MKKTIIFICFIYLVSCDPYDSRLSIINNCPNNIFVRLAIDTTEEQNWLKEHTLSKFYGENKEYEMKNHYSKQGDTIIIPVKGSYNQLFKDSSGKIYFYILDTVKMYEYSLRKIPINETYLRLDFTKQDIESKNWLIELDNCEYPSQLSVCDREQ